MYIFTLRLKEIFGLQDLKQLVPHRLSAAPAAGCEHVSGPVGAHGELPFPSSPSVSQCDPADTHKPKKYVYKRMDSSSALIFLKTPSP